MLFMILQRKTLSAFILRSSMKGRKDSTVGNTVLHVVLQAVIREKLRVMLCQVMDKLTQYEPKGMRPLPCFGSFSLHVP